MKLIIGNKNYSSWSLRAWLPLRHHGLEFEEVQIPLRLPDSSARVLQFSPTGKVPALLDGAVSLWESLAISEYVAEKFPQRGLWPEDPHARAVARAVSLEMHAGFPALRTHLPLNCRGRFASRDHLPGVAEEIERMRELWLDCRLRFGQGGHFLFGGFTIADAVFAPVALRFQTYGVELPGVAGDYGASLLALPAMREWQAAAKEEPWVIEEYEGEPREEAWLMGNEPGEYQ